MDILFQLILTTILCIAYVPNISTTPNKFIRLCYKSSERLVRTNNGFRCVATKRSPDKRSAAIGEEPTSPLVSYINRTPKLIRYEDVNSILPKLASASETQFRKVIIKNNRGPWRIANQLFKRSPMRSPGPNPVVDRRWAETDGLLVAKSFVDDSGAKESKPTNGSIKEQNPEPSDRAEFPEISDTSVEQQFIRNLPKINLFAKTVDKNKFRNFRFNSDIDVIDLMEEDSVVESRNYNNINFTNNSAVDKRLARSALNSDPNSDSYDEPSSEEKSTGTIAPIKIFVFLSRNRNGRDWSTDSSNNRYNIARRPQTLELIAESSAAAPPKTTTTTLTRTTTTPPPTTTTTEETTTTEAPVQIRRLLKDFDLNEFTAKVVKKSEEDEAREDDYVDSGTTEQSLISIGDISALTAAPVSRNWNFICGKRKGFFADVDNDCRTYYQCSVRGRQRWECPPGTRFNQFSSTCDWMENVNCLSFRDLVNDKLSLTDQFDKSVEMLSVETSSTSPTTTTAATYEPEDYFDDNEE